MHWISERRGCRFILMLKRILSLTLVIVAFTKFSIAADVRNIEPLTANAEIWQSSKSKFTGKFPDMAWKYGEGDGEYVHENKGMVFWGEPVHQVNLTETDEKITSLKFTLLDQGSALMMKPSDFDALAMRWNKIVSERLKSQGKRVPSISMGNVNHARIAWNTENSLVVLSANKGVKPDRIELICYAREYGLAQIKLKGQQLANANDDGKDEIAEADPDGDESIDEGLAAKDVKAEIKAKIKEINARNAPDGVTKDVQDAVNLLNVYRFLSRVPYDVEADKAMIAAAYDAAKICSQKGDLSHDFGHSTDKCNLAMNGGEMSMESSVSQYMDDAGANNRERRGHRRWCLNHKMGKTGFGIDGGYSAMYSMDQSDSGIRKNYSYPGHGFYPLNYLHGNGWSYYIVDGSAPADTVVQVWKLKKYEENPPSMGDDPDGRKLDVAFKFIYDNTIVFEPDKDPITRRGSYLVRLKGSGLNEQYLVHLY